MVASISWSLAPKGTTHYNFDENTAYEWEKHTKNRVYQWNNVVAGWRFYMRTADIQINTRIARADNERGFTNEVVEDDLGGRSVENVATESLIQQTLKQRGSRYGKFEDHARLAQVLQDALRNHTDSYGVRGWDRLSATAKQALTMICDKQARIINGDPTYDDNWVDIQGYAKLEENILKGVENHG